MNNNGFFCDSLSGNYIIVASNRSSNCADAFKALTCRVRFCNSWMKHSVYHKGSYMFTLCTDANDEDSLYHRNILEVCFVTKTFPA